MSNVYFNFKCCNVARKYSYKNSKIYKKKLKICGYIFDSYWNEYLVLKCETCEIKKYIKCDTLGFIIDFIREDYINRVEITGSSDESKNINLM